MPWQNIIVWGLKQQNFICSRFSSLQVQDQDVGRLVPPPASLLGLQMLIPCCVFTQAFLCAGIHGVSLIRFPSFHKDISQVGLGPTLTDKVLQMKKSLPAVQETQVQCLGQEDTLDKGMATHSSIHAWRIPWTEEPGGLQRAGHKYVTNSPWGHKELDTTEWLTHTNSFSLTSCPLWSPVRP